jgi:inhibitor of KinA sporulation pathway (predicted exonuclease)
MRAALELCSLTVEGTHHRGIDDARNIARMLPFILDPKLKKIVALNRAKHEGDRKSQRVEDAIARHRNAHEPRDKK